MREIFRKEFYSQRVEVERMKDDVLLVEHFSCPLFNSLIKAFTFLDLLAKIPVPIIPMDLASGRSCLRHETYAAPMRRPKQLV
jgi:hypothetical protein